MSQQRHSGTFLPAIAIVTLCAILGVGVARAVESSTEIRDVKAWRAERLHNLTDSTGWLTLAGLFWFKEGDNTFGRDAHNTLVLKHRDLLATVGTFVLKNHQVEFIARHSNSVKQNGQAVTQIKLTSDIADDPTILSIGTLQFFVIERDGRVGLRVRDTQSAARTHFKGLTYFPINDAWLFNATFEPYEPVKHINIVNILGMTEAMDSPGAVVFTKNGREYRLDTLLEEPNAKELFIMFADASSGRETYGAGRFLYVSLPQHGHVLLDFNKAYSPPCAFSDFATCPLPPRQNRLDLRVDAGEKKYSRPE